MLNAHQINFRETIFNRTNPFHFISAPVGSGKTEALIRHIRDQNQDNYIIVTPTRELAQEIKNRLDIALVNSTQGENVSLLISDENIPGLVGFRTLNAIRERYGDQSHTLIVTTENFRNLLPGLADETKALYHLFLDEGIEAIDQFSFNPQHPELFMDPIEIGDDNSFSISEGQTELLRTVAHHPTKLAAIGREELSIQVYQDLAKALVSGLYDVYGTVGPNQIRAIALLHPESFMTFRSVTMIMAIFEQSLLALFWTEKYNISFQQSEVGTELFDTHREKGHLIRIHHVLHEGDNASRMSLERHWQTGEPRANGLTQERVIDHIALAVETRFGEAPYCWSANRFFMNHPPILLGNRMPVKCAGLNGFQNFDIVISLASVNPPPWVKNMVLEQISISEEELYELWKLSHTYQIIGRCSLRLRDANRPIDVVVISRNCADNIHRLFEGSQIVGQLTDLPCYSAMQRRRGPARHRPIHYTGADNTAWTRYRKANEDTAMTKEEWYTQIRNPADERLHV